MGEKQELKYRAGKAYVTRCEATLRTKESWTFTATSIHGDGNKIALPPSVLASLNETGMLEDARGPLTFRIGVVDPEYKFPASDSVKKLMERIDEEDYEEENTSAFLDELLCRYLAYTHASVVEFTQDEGNVGLPKAVSEKLFRGRGNIPAKKTVDPSGSVSDNEEMNTNLDDDQTPGHLAWGKFSVPDTDVEVTLLTLPKGKSCTFVPTIDSLKNGFNSLKDVKAVLEQSLVRTRATISLADTVHCWHRGVKFDLNVSSVTPPDFAAVSCINTDIEVDIGTPKFENKEDNKGIKKNSEQDGRRLGDSTQSKETTGNILGGGLGGRHVYDKSAGNSLTDAGNSAQRNMNAIPVPVQLPPEPISNGKDVSIIQIRGPSKSGKRRFDLDSQMADVFSFAAFVTNMDDFHLVTRFPRKVYIFEEMKELTLRELGFQEGQNMLLVERI